MIILRRRKLGLTSCREIANSSQTGIRVVRNDKIDSVDVEGEGYLVRWGCTSTVPKGLSIINRAEAIHAVNDKRGFRRVLNEAELCPQTFFSLGEWAQHVDPHMFVEEDGHLPLEDGVRYIIRPAKHAQGKRLHVVSHTQEAQHWCNKYGEGNYYISPLIDKVAELRVFVVQGRVACIANKIPADTNAVAWNVAKGGKFENVNWDSWHLRAVRYAVEAFNLSGLDFGGVDVMIDGDGNCYVLEINSAPSLTSPYRQSCMAKCFDYINMNGKEHIPMIKEKGGYRKFIHPAITSKAILAE